MVIGAEHARTGLFVRRDDRPIRVPVAIAGSGAHDDDLRAEPRERFGRVAVGAPMVRGLVDVDRREGIGRGREPPLEEPRFGVTREAGTERFVFDDDADAVVVVPPFRT